jgi:hypothetical protein
VSYQRRCILVSLVSVWVTFGAPPAIGRESTGATDFGEAPVAVRVYLSLN